MLNLFVIDATTPLRIYFQRLPDTGQTKYMACYDGNQFTFTVSNENFTTLIGFYRHHFCDVTVSEVVL